jgi:ketosteroid isomerase-like protein
MGMTAIDFEDIRQLHARFCHALDFAAVDELVACFAPEACFEHADEVHRGEEALRRFAAALATESNGHIRHSVLTSLIDGDGVTARSLSYVMITRDFGPPNGKNQVTRAAIVVTGLYADELVKVDGQWAYSSRSFRRDGWPEVLERVGKPLEIDPIIASANGAGAGTPMSPLDHEAIRQLLARYGYTLDFADQDGFVDCFTPDGSFEVLTLGDPNLGSQTRIQGHQALRQMAVAMQRLRGHARHGAITSLIEGDAERALVSSYAFFTNDYGTPRRTTQRDNATLQTTGIVRDEVIKQNGRWLIKRRTFRYDGWPDIIDRVGKPLELGLFHFDDESTGDGERVSTIPRPETRSVTDMTDTDYTEIRELLARSSQTFDLGDVEGFVACFAKDGALRSSSTAEELVGMHEGRAELRKFATAAMVYSAGHARHSAVNTLIDGDGTGARATSYVIVSRDYGPPSAPGQLTYSELVTTGMCFDQLVKIDGRWVFARREFRHDGLPDVLERVGNARVK